ncbi:zinc finger protein 182-like [Topomyia yanbarensis]|uniref:zinc finger protein 182-like n=1 Tax=Topomyia yanbarensis TaxID=2498891 RepID=UPI00273B88C4|nr:zinc finger protein 182-like [Topomyia yanbarensis]
MSCCIQSCPGHTGLISFPKDARFRKRWLQAVKIGNGCTEWKEADGELICSTHFADQNDLQYQEPTEFINNRGQHVSLASCRLCLRFGLESQMFPLKGQLAGQNLKSVILNTLRIVVKKMDFLRHICRPCLIKLDMIRTIQNTFLLRDAQYQCLQQVKPSLQRNPDVIEEVIEEIIIEFSEGQMQLVQILGEENGERSGYEVKLDQSQNVTENVEGEALSLPHLENSGSKSNAEQTQYQEDIKEDDLPLPSTENSKCELNADEPQNHKESDKEDIFPLQPTENPSFDMIPDKFDDTESETEALPLPKIQYWRKAKKEQKAETIYGITSRSCYICPNKIQLENADELMGHLIETHAGQDRYACEQCEGLTFPWVEMYNRHLAMHDPTERSFKCSFCAIRYRTKLAANKHENTVHGANNKLPKANKRYPYSQGQCEVCGKLFASAKETLLHRAAKHENGYAAQCKICHKTFERRKNLVSHVLTHTGELPYKCPICDERFRVVTDRKKHVLSVHEGKEPYECRRCQLTFKHKQEFQRHRNTVHATPAARRRIYRCLLCPEETYVANMLEVHVNNVHSEQEYPYVTCPLCPEKFFSDLQQQTHHHYRHTDKRPVKEFKCELCNRSGMKKSTFIVHMAQKHGAEKKHVCLICGKKYALRHSLWLHEKTHHKKTEASFECDFCDERFESKSDMVDHWRKTHA